MALCAIAEVGIGEFIGDYQVLDVLGRGPMGTTFHVFSNALNKEFALKTLKLIDEIPLEWVDRLEAQTAVLQKLVHPNIDTPIGSGRFDDRWLQVKDFVDDGQGGETNLGCFLERHGHRLSSYQVCHIVVQLLRALEAAHNYQDANHTTLCHGNLKPSNVLVSSGLEMGGASPLEVKLTDFEPYGLRNDDLVLAIFKDWQRMVEAQPSLLKDKARAAALSTLFIPFDYRAPEWSGRPTREADIYSMGVLIYEMLTGTLPGGYCVEPSKVREDIPEAWDAIVIKCLQRRVEARYRKAGELLQEVRSAFSDVLSKEVVSTPVVTAERHSITPRGMIYIPGGSFLMGSTAAGSDALPQYECEIGGFYIDRAPVTNLQFSCFVLETGYETEAEKAGEASLWIDGEWRAMEGISWKNPFGRALPDDFDRHPVVQVTYRDATAYAQWLERRLPTEQEWEYAAKGGLKEARFPWGDNSSTAHAHINSEGPAAVMKHHPNGYGLYDMAGNVWEWTGSWYQPYPGNEVPSAHFGEKYRVVRGGCWMYDLSHCLISYRNANQPEFAYPTVGFRTAKSVG